MKYKNIEISKKSANSNDFKQKKNLKYEDDKVKSVV